MDVLETKEQLKNIFRAMLGGNTVNNEIVITPEEKPEEEQEDIPEETDKKADNSVSDIVNNAIAKALTDNALKG